MGLFCRKIINISPQRATTSTKDLDGKQTYWDYAMAFVLQIQKLFGSQELQLGRYRLALRLASQNTFFLYIGRHRLTSDGINQQS